ncbi:MAG: hypothetical protein CVU38_02355 [Chloroflexi bacterium HGW-Chloroflexi-1]|nr:MAG: hypothetical protein CVU38_02355 [Chloroflexi bacterium HGW-Chloroflexi-1]
MRIREIVFTDFRAFRGERRISFVDEVTGEIRPVSVLAGSNGSGKTTIMDAIEALLGFVLEPDSPNRLVEEAFETGLIHLEVELSPAEGPNGQRTLMDDPPLRTLHIAVGRRNLAPSSPERSWPNLYCRLVQRGVQGQPFVRKSPLAERLRKAVSAMHQGQADLYGGFIYFPHDRRLGASKGGPIEPPPAARQWRFRFSETDRWQGSLEQLWVWQNYLDLEQGKADHPNLAPFVTTVEAVLGASRGIAIQEGRVLVPTGWRDELGNPAQVRLDQLPSGEQQVLLLFGELARRRRAGAVIGIDEVENSLHPTLQRLVIWNLHRIAREWNAQVIVATHSLEVINSVRGGAFINLDFPEDRFNLPAPANDEGAA